jgi:hypothetical protein
MSDTQQAKNTDRELWRGPDDGNGSYYADSIHVTAAGGIGIDVGGRVIVKSLRAWHALALGVKWKEVSAAIRDLKLRNAEMQSTLEQIKTCCIDNAGDTVRHDLALKFVGDVADKACRA